MDLELRDVELRRLVDGYRPSCLWFLREDYYPTTPQERERVLALIVQHGDHHAFRRAAEMRRWLSQPPSAMSAGD